LIVVDSSALLDFMVLRAVSSRVDELIVTERVLHAPHLIETEMLHVLRRWCARGRLETQKAEAALERLTQLRLVYHEHGQLRWRVWQLRAGFTAYDATYVALAELLRARLLTSDARLFRAAAGLVPTELATR
jgi:predicted nucleic acid-binding protein